MKKPKVTRPPLRIEQGGWYVYLREWDEQDVSEDGMEWFRCSVITFRYKDNGSIEVPTNLFADYKYKFLPKGLTLTKRVKSFIKEAIKCVE